MNPGPSLEQLTRRLMDAPAEFREPVAIGKTDGVSAPAVVGEMLQHLGLASLPVERLLRLHPPTADRDRRNYLQLVLIGSWLLSDSWFANRPELAPASLEWLLSGLESVAASISADHFLEESDRREELARLCLNALGIVPAGETEELAHDRLMTISTMERKRVMEASRQAEERARQVREELQRKAAQAAAAKGSRE